MLAVKDYEKATTKFHAYLQEQIFKLLEEINKIDNNMGYKKMFDELKSTKEPSKFLEYSDHLSKISESIRENLAVIAFFKDENALDAEQVQTAMDAILSDPDFVNAATNLADSITKEKLKEKIEKCRSIVNGDIYDHQFFLEMLRGSNLTEEEITDVLTYDALNSTKLGQIEIKDETPQVEETHESEEIETVELPSLEDTNPDRDEAKVKFDLIKAEVNGFIDQYYYLFEGKTSQQMELYRRVSALYDINAIKESFVEKEETLMILLNKLMDSRDQVELCFKVQPFKLDSFTLCYDELVTTFEEAKKVSERFEQNEEESVPTPTDVYFLLDGDNPMFSLDGLDEEAKGELRVLIDELEQGLYDYERGRGKTHTMVRQQARKDLNAFVNKKRNYSVSYLRIRPEGEEKSKSLVLFFSKSNAIFNGTKTVLKRDDILDSSIESIKTGNPEFIEKQRQFRDTLNTLVGERGETL